MEIRADLPVENWQWSRVELLPMRRAVSSLLWKWRKEEGPMMIVPAPTFTPGGNVSSLSIGVILPVSCRSGCAGRPAQPDLHKIRVVQFHEEQRENHRFGDRVLVS